MTQIAGLPLMPMPLEGAVAPESAATGFATLLAAALGAPSGDGETVATPSGDAPSSTGTTLPPSVGPGVASDLAPLGAALGLAANATPGTPSTAASAPAPALPTVVAPTRAPRGAEPQPHGAAPVTTPAGPTLLYPQRLVASGYISQLPGAGGHATDAVLTQRAVGAAPSAPRAPTVAIGAAAVVVAGDAPAPRDAHGAAALRAATEARAGERLAQAAEQRVTAQAPLAADAEWLARRLHCVVEPDGAVAIWLRDYRLDARETQALVAATVAALRAAGAQPQRITVNGQPLWQAAGEVPCP